jgi:hypothetical protein
VAKDIGFGERWVRELANADTPEKVFKAKAKKAATATNGPWAVQRYL